MPLRAASPRQACRVWPAPVSRLTKGSQRGTHAVRKKAQCQSSCKRLGILARHRFVLALSTSLLITVLMTVFVGYYAVFAIILGITVGIGVLLVLSFPPSSQNPAGEKGQGWPESDRTRTRGDVGTEGTGDCV